MNTQEKAAVVLPPQTFEFPSESAPNGHRRLDVYRSIQPEAPTLLYAHGGGWRVGNREMDRYSLLIPLVRGGLNVVSTDYALTGEAPFPANLNDIYGALSWIVANGPNHGISTSKLLLGGASAGAHLTSLAVLRGLHDEAVRELIVEHVRGIVQWFPLLDVAGVLLDQRYGLVESLSAFGKQGAKRGFPFPEKLPALLGADGGRVRLEDLSIGQALELDPRYHLNKIRAGDIPPSVILTGTADDREIKRDSIRLRDAIHSVGGQSELLFIHDADHQDTAFGRPAPVGAVVGFAADVTNRTDSYKESGHG